jgi:hypothetical protein
MSLTDDPRNAVYADCIRPVSPPYAAAAEYGLQSRRDPPDRIREGEGTMKSQERPWDLEPSMIALGAVYAVSIVSGILIFAGYGL